LRYLLDTNTISAALYEPQGYLSGKIVRLSHVVCTSIIVAAELRFGVAKAGARALAQTIDGFLARIEVLPFSPPADATYAQLRAALERKGKPIGGNDMLIAAHALAIRATLVTANVREFSRVSSLNVENWLR
jgi:tRNA(fMet)-specific endonuclease VapC